MEGQHFLKSRSSLEDIHQQIASLRRENRFLKFGLVFCLVIATLPYLAGFQPETIRAKRLVTEKVEFVRDGKTVSSINVHPIGNWLVISGKDGEPMVFLGEGILGGDVGVYNKEGKAVVIMGNTPFGGMISVVGEKDKPVALISNTPLGGMISVADENGEPMATMSKGLLGGVIILNDEKGKLKWRAP